MGHEDRRLSAWYYLLTPQSKEVLAELDRMIAEPFHQLGVARCRALIFPPIPTARPEVSSRELWADKLVRVRLYHPAPGDPKTRPVVFYFHGGGFFMGSLDGVDEVCRALSIASSAIVVSVDYRLAPEHPYPTPINDCILAVEWIKDHAASLRIDPSRVGLAGDSAGAALAINAARHLHGEGQPALAAALAYPPTELNSARASWAAFEDAPLITEADARWCFGLYLGEEPDPGDVDVALPCHGGDVDFLPPTFLCTAEVDVLRDDAEHLATLIADAGTEVEQRRYDGVFHGFFTEVGLYPEADDAVARAGAFLRQRLSREH